MATVVGGEVDVTGVVTETGTGTGVITVVAAVDCSTLAVFVGPVAIN